MEGDYAYPLHLIRYTPGVPEETLLVRSDLADLTSACDAMWTAFFEDLCPAALFDSAGKMVAAVNATMEE